MIAASVSIQQVLPGRAEEYRALAAEYKRYLDGFGAETSFRQSLYADESVGTIAMVNLFHSPADRAAALDKVLGDMEHNPGLAAMLSADPPAVQVSRTLLDSIDPSATMPEPANVLRTTVFGAQASDTGHAVAALRTAIARHRRLGVTANAWHIRTGALATAYLYSLGTESMTALHEFGEQNREVEEPAPIQHATEVGTLTLQSVQISTLFEV